jgi:hypothetical protein
MGKRSSSSLRHGKHGVFENMRAMRGRPALAELLFIHSEGLPCRLGRHLTRSGLAVVAHTLGKDAL